MWSTLFIAVCAVLLLSRCSFAAPLQQSESRKFLVLSDIHMDLYYNGSYTASDFCRPSDFPIVYDDNCGTDDYDQEPPFPNYKYGKFGCDSPVSLVEWTLQAMAEATPSPDFILVPGDFIAHCLPSVESSIVHMIAAVDLIVSYFPDTIVLPVVGNNDVFPHNQLPLGPSELMTAYADLWDPLLRGSGLDSYEDTMALGGFYSAMPVRGLRVITINTLYYCVTWCSSTTTVCDEDDIDDEYREADPVGQFAWFEKQLIDATLNEERVIIQSHESPGRSRGFDDLWLERYQITFDGLLREYASVIEGLFFAHTHRDEFFMLLRENDDYDEVENLATFFISGAISPRAGQNPSFRTVEYSPATLALKDYTVGSLQLAVVVLAENVTNVGWKEEYRFTTEYNVPNIGKAQMLTMLEETALDDAQFELYVANWACRSPAASYTKHDKYEFLCAMGTTTNSEYDDCTDEFDLHVCSECDAARMSQEM